MNRTQLIDFVKAETEHKMDTVVGFDWQEKLTNVMQDFAQGYRYWWRKKRFTFVTAAATPTYDLTAITTTPTGAGVFVEEITAVVGLGGTSGNWTLNPVTDDEAIAGYVNDAVTADKPSVWMPEDNDLVNAQILRFGPIPNGVYTLQVHAWMLPNPAQDSADDRIYIIPPWLHHVVQSGLETEVWRLTYGAEDARYVTAKQTYEAKKAQAKLKRSIDSSHAMQYKNFGNESVRSTGGAIRSTD
jgi:hypothetical protein